MQRSVLLRRLRSVARTRVILVVLVAVALVAAVGCAGGHDQREAARLAMASSTSSRSSAPMPSPANTGTVGLRNTAAPVTAATPGPAVLHLLADLRSVSLRSPLPPYLRARGVGTWTYIDAGHAGSGYAGSAQVLIRSSIEGETVTAIYDVFAVASQATARLRVAESNFSRYNLADGFRLLHLSPAVSAFCGSQAGPAGATTCWFNYKVTNGNVTITVPSASGDDGPAALQAMLSHLLALTG
jgi:hypothetical protein